MPAVVARAARARIVLLGEDHEVRDHHRWQTDVLAAIAGRVGVVRVGFEMFPRRVQPALDRWSAGALDEERFLVESDWAHVWGADPTLYWPLFHAVRLHRMPMVALNVERTLVHRVATDGWTAVPDDAREGVSTPAPASARYRETLASAWRAHAGARGDDSAALERFVEAQLLWDRAMAEAIRSALATRPRGIVVGIMGRGHVEHRDGVPAQLAALGAPRPVVLVPWTADRPCEELVPGLADAVFGVDDVPAAAS